MAKELTHRADELKELGWAQDDVLRYAELWDYRQRWGSINLEREDRQFLRKAESALPKIISGKVSSKKPTQEKSYYLWLSFYRDQMVIAEGSFDIDEGSQGAWSVLLDEEIRLIDYYEPVLGLPDTIKAKGLYSLREEFITKATKLFSKDSIVKEFDFQKPLDQLKEKGEKTSWKCIRDSEFSSNKNYLVLNKQSVEIFKTQLRKELPQVISSIFPSLKDTDKPLPPENWSRD